MLLPTHFDVAVVTIRAQFERSSSVTRAEGAEGTSTSIIDVARGGTRLLALPRESIQDAPPGWFFRWQIDLAEPLRSERRFRRLIYRNYGAGIEWEELLPQRACALRC